MIPNLQDKQRIIYAVLHWGLGHATRSIPIIQHLLDQGKDVLLAGDGSSLGLLRETFPKLPYRELPPYNIHYRHQSMVINMLFQFGKISSTIRKEKKVIQNISKEWNADLILSDSRFGAYSNDTKSILITHQINMKHRFLAFAWFASVINRNVIHRFDECWVPDYADRRLSGELSEPSKLKIPVKYIGASTRLDLSMQSPEIDHLLLLSGPEPARTRLETRLVKEYSSHTDQNIHLVRGTKNTSYDKYPNHIKVHDLVNHHVLNDLISKSAHIISRSGYTTIMDLQRFDRKITYIPTQGQTEQEYLAQFHSTQPNIEIGE